MLELHAHLISLAEIFYAKNEFDSSCLGICFQKGAITRKEDGDGTCILVFVLTEHSIMG
jgi:hypothetical protein